MSDRLNRAFVRSLSGCSAACRMGKREGNANLKPFPKGVSGNPGGLPGMNLSALYARRFFEEHPEGISCSMAEDLKGFNPYGFNVLADPAMIKLSEVKY